MASDASPPISPLPEAGHDPADPNDAANLDKDSPTPPLADPTADMDHDLSDNDSVLSDVDEAQFEDFDPAAIDIDERPAIAVDEDNVKLLGRHKRRRDGDATAEGGTAELARRKKKEGRREKPKKSRKKQAEEDDGLSGGEELEPHRPRKKKGVAEDPARRERRQAQSVRSASPESEREEKLDPEAQRRKMLDAKMDAALQKASRSRRRGDDIDISEMADEEIASLRTRMADAAQRDVEARSADPPRPALQKLQMLPEVTAFLNRNGPTIENAIVDPENNLLEAVRFFLEPLNDGSLPAYNIQRDLFAALARLPIGKDTLIASGIGKVVLFYTRSKRPEPGIKRQAERLLAEWTRPILKRSDNYRSRILEERSYTPEHKMRRDGVSPGPGSQPSSSAALSEADRIRRELAAQRRARELAVPSTRPNRAVIEQAVKTYTVVPRSNIAPQEGGGRLKASRNDEVVRRMLARQLAASKARRR